MGSMNRAAFGAKVYPGEPKEGVPELFEKKKGMPMPDWLREDYEKRINKAVKPDNGFLPK